MANLPRTFQVCKYSREVTRDVESATTLETEKTSTFLGRERTTTEKTTKKLITKVTEHFWEFEGSFEVGRPPLTEPQWRDPPPPPPPPQKPCVTMPLMESTLRTGSSADDWT